MKEIPVSRQHQRWRNNKAMYYVRTIDKFSAALSDIIYVGANLSKIDQDRLRLLADRINGIVDKAERKETA